MFGQEVEVSDRQVLAQKPWVFNPTVDTILPPEIRWFVTHS